MLSISTIYVFSVAAALLALTPGADMLYIATRSAAQGRAAGVVSALGVHTGVLVHTLAAALGLSALIAASAAAFSLIKYAGAAYLVYLGIHTLLSKAETLEVEGVTRLKLRDVYFQGVITNVLNPKLILFFLAFLPQFVDPARGSVTLQLVLLGLLSVAVMLPIDLGVALFSSAVSGVVRGRGGLQKVGKWATGGVFIALGVGTAFTGRKP